MNAPASSSNFKLVIFDQNAISNLALNPDKAWSEILELVRSCVNSGKVLCPVPVETFIESVHLPAADQKRVQNLCLELSQGYFVKYFWELIAQEILATVRPNTDTFPLWMPQQINEVTEEQNFKHREAIWKERNSMEADVNSFERPARDKGFTIAQAQELSISNWMGMMRSYLNKFRNGRVIGDEQFIIQQTLGSLNQLRVTDKEIAGLLKGIQNGSWLKIPLLLCWLFLDGFLTFDYIQRGRRFELNDEWDKFRAAAAFQFAHCFITDRGMATMLRQLKFQDDEIFAVFSVAETKEIIAYFKSINDDTAEH